MSAAAPAEEAVLASPHRFMLVSDLDWTMVDHKDGTHDKLRAFNRLWLSQFAADSLLVFSTGRSPELFHELAAEVPLLTPDILVCSVGTEILINGQADKEWEAFLDQGWDRARAAAVAASLSELTPQGESEQRPHKISYKLKVADPERVVEGLRAALAAEGLQAAVIFSGGEDLDILPSSASKGKALSFLLRQLEGKAGRPSAGVMVCGDSGNDVELFAVPGVHGCMVANAHAELRDWCAANGGEHIYAARRDGPGGIFDALHHFGFVHPTKSDAARRRATLTDNLAWYEDWCNAAVPRDEAACRKQLETIDAAFEYVHPSGAIMLRQAFADWFATQGYGCHLAAAPDAGRYAMWLDRFSERELAPGVWVVRYMELHQPFAAGKHTAAERKGRWASVVLVQQPDGSYRITYIHESTVPPGAARA